jgi:midasin
VLQALAVALRLPSERAAHYDQMHRPQMQVGTDSVAIGRVILRRSPGVAAFQQSSAVFAHTAHALRLMERAAACVRMVEPLLLVGETGTGKTALVQYLARQVGAELTVLNLSNQSDSTDFIGGYKPVDEVQLCLPLAAAFTTLFARTFPQDGNVEYIQRVARYAERRKWKQLLHACRLACAQFTKLAAEAEGAFSPSEGPQAGTKEEGAKAKKKAKKGKKAAAVVAAVQADWTRFEAQLVGAEEAVLRGSSGATLAFAFVEGALIRALQTGRWLLLDEINLAPPEALERLAGLLDGAEGSIVVSERGDVEPVIRHPAFRVFGAMNPATDVGKRDLPAAVKNHFTEMTVCEPSSREDLRVLVHSYLGQIGTVTQEVVDMVVEFYLTSKEAMLDQLVDSAGQRPQYSLRTLARALEYARMCWPTYGQHRSLYDGFAMAFHTLLDHTCAQTMENMLHQHFLQGKKLKSLMRAPPAPGPNFVLFSQFWVEAGPLERPGPEEKGAFVLTATVNRNLSSLARAVLMRRHPVLLQGPTSAGKTSLVEYLAVRTGHRFVRLNNHEHTDLQEYLGRYVTDQTGRLVFMEGALVQAVRQGHWIVLDELNLAPTDVLEALNRLLDDNRELFVPELNELVRPHPHFMLFATQNPPGAYAGRKALSRAFRNRFSELFVGDIPDEELQQILHERCQVAPSYAAKMIAVMRDLQRRRQTSKVFAGKEGFITPRDLFRWAGRRAGDYTALAEDGYMLLAERLRDPQEKEVVKQVLERTLRVKVDPPSMYTRTGPAPFEALQTLLQDPSTPKETVAAMDTLAWSPGLMRLYTLVHKCLEAGENVLLVGETGCGKTTVCQMLALLRQQRLHIINCHQHSETADFLGGFRPSRERERQAGAPPFAWEDGPLVHAMRQGDLMLVDELNLAEDSVIERLNSVLEKPGLLVLAEKGGRETEELRAATGSVGP